MTTILGKHKALMVAIILILFYQLSFAQSGSGMPYEGIDTVRGIAWRYAPGLSRTDPNWRIRKEYSLNQSDYLVVLNCKDSSVVYTVPWVLPQSCLSYRSKYINKLERDTLDKHFKICWQDYYNDLSNKAKRDTVYINSDNSILTDPSYSSKYMEDMFFELNEKQSSPNSSDSLIIEFYSLEEVKKECITGYYFRRKSLKMYSDGKPDGTWIQYDTQGNLRRKMEYELGKIVKDETF